ncbi:MAG: chromosomal replication initiator protein DnaA [bacterium]|nr:chromosomal replication initiator protein DnaA [bacterium]
MSQQAQALWAQAQEKIKERIGSGSYDTWLRPVKAASMGDTSITLRVPNQFFIQWLEQHYLPFIKEAIKETALRELDVIFSAPTEQPKPSLSEKQLPPPLPIAIDSDSQLRERYTFDKFVIGKSNEFAHAAARAVAEAPGKVYNPFFIYGGVGLGKTHLTHAIGNYVRAKKPKAKIFYTPAENFMNEMVAAIQNRKILDFKNHYRNLDVLLIDDIQFLSEKTGMQEEIFHTFNTLYDSRKQIVLTSDRPPKDISQLEERLVSRFQSGLVADIQSPDLETRIAILKKKAEIDNLKVPDEVIFFMAEAVKSNIRELEGSLVRVTAFASVADRELTLELAQEALKHIISQKSKSISIDSIQRTVANHFSISDEALRSSKRTKELVLPRHIAMYLSRTLTTSSLNDIGKRFGGKDHSTVHHAIDKMNKDILKDQDTARQVELITKTIKGE